MRGDIVDNKTNPVRANDMLISKENKNQSRAYNNSFSETAGTGFNDADTWAKFIWCAACL